jgi:hypothetical protein
MFQGKIERNERERQKEREREREREREIDREREYKDSFLTKSKVYVALS